MREEDAEKNTKTKTKRETETDRRQKGLETDGVTERQRHITKFVIRVLVRDDIFQTRGSSLFRD